MAGVAVALRTATEGDEATKLRQGKDEVPMRVRLAKPDRDSAKDLRELVKDEGRLVVSEVKDKDAIVGSIRDFLGKGR